MPKTTKPKKQIQQNLSIEENIRRLREAKKGALSRKRELEEIIEVMKEKVRAGSEGPEIKKIHRKVLNDARCFLRIIFKWQDGLDSEIKRVSVALNALEKDDIKAVKKTFKTFILTDVALSAQSIMLAFYDFDDYIASAKSIFLGDEPSE
jgi:hypothetical protein